MLDSSRQLLACIRADAFPADIHRVATDAMQGGLGGVIVSPIYVARVGTLLRSEAKRALDLFALINFPSGTSKPTIKAIEATSCLKDGATGVIVTAHAPHVLRGDVDAIRAELLEITRAARAVRKDARLIAAIDLAGLRIRMDVQNVELRERLADVCRAIREGAFDGVAVLSPSSTSQDVRLLRETAESLMLFIAGPIPDDVSSVVDRMIVEVD